MDHKDVARRLHEGLAKNLLDRMENATDEEPLTSAEINQIRQFLKDNNVTGLAYAPQAVRQLDQELEFDDLDAPVQLRPIREG